MLPVPAGDYSLVIRYSVERSLWCGTPETVDSRLRGNDGNAWGKGVKVALA
jgi:hypothetical protein